MGWAWRELGADRPLLQRLSLSAPSSTIPTPAEPTQDNDRVAQVGLDGSTERGATRVGEITRTECGAARCEKRGGRERVTWRWGECHEGGEVVVVVVVRRW